MALRRLRWLGPLAAGALLPATPAGAYLFWTRPALTGAPVIGNEPGVVLPLAGAGPKELNANLIWTMRAGLNVAALQCQFAPELRTVENYNNMLRQHAVELQSTYAALTAYFKRTGGKTGLTQLDQYTTRTYNSFSTLQAQRIFCETAAAIGRETLQRPRGELGQVAAARLREFRNSLIPIGDAAFAVSADTLSVADPSDLGPVLCPDRKGRYKACKS